MAVATQYSPKRYKPGAAMAAEPIGWQFLSPADVRVTHVADATGVVTVLAAGTGYALAGNGPAGTATVRALEAWPADDLFLVERVTTIAQDARWVPHEPAPAADTERQLDRQTLVQQEQDAIGRDTQARAIMVPPGEVATELPPAFDRRGGNKILGFDNLTGVPMVKSGADFKGDPGGHVMAIGPFLVASTLLIPTGTDQVHTTGFASAGVGSARYAYDPEIDVDYVAANPRTAFISANARGFKLAETALTPEQFGASGDVDSSDAVVAMAEYAAASGLPIDVNNSVRVDTQITVSGGLTMRGSGRIDLSGGGEIIVGSGVTRIPDLSANIALFGTRLQFAAPHGLAVNDVVAVWNPTDFSQSLHRVYYRAGDMFRISEIISATEVRIYGVAREFYAAAAVRVFKLNGGHFRASGIEFVPPPTGFPLFLDGLVDVILDGLRVGPGSDYAAIEVHRCYNIGIRDPEITVFGGDAYPITLSNSQKITVSATRGMYSKRHCIGLGGRSDDASISTGDIIIHGMIGENIASNGIGAADIHGDCKRVTYVDCLLSMANMSGEDNTFRGCTITGQPPENFASGNVVNGTEVVGGTFTFDSCTLVSAGNGTSDPSHMLFDLAKQSKDFRLVIRNCIFQNVGDSAAAAVASLIRLEVGSDGAPRTHKIDVDIDGLKYVGAAQPLTVLGIAGSNNVSAVTQVRMASLSGPVDRLYAASNFANYSIAFFGPGQRPGMTAHADTSITLARVSTEHQLFDADISADRVITMPDAAAAMNGDEFIFTRTGGGDFTIRAPGLFALRQYDWVRAVFLGVSANGVWKVAARGSLAGLNGYKEFGDTDAFIEVSRGSQFLGARTNAWIAPLAADRSISFGAGALQGDCIRIVRAASSTGSFVLSVAGLKSLATGEWCELTYGGAGWVVTASGAL